MRRPNDTASGPSTLRRPAEASQPIGKKLEPVLLGMVANERTRIAAPGQREKDKRRPRWRKRTGEKKGSDAKDEARARLLFSAIWGSSGFCSVHLTALVFVRLDHWLFLL